MNFQMISALFGMIGSFFSALSAYRNKNWLNFIIKSALFVGAVIAFMQLRQHDEKPGFETSAGKLRTAA